MNEPQTPPASSEERIEAIETMLRYLLEQLESDTDFTADALLNWIRQSRKHERIHHIADARAQVVFAQLCERLRLVDGEANQQDTNPAAQQAARTAIDKSRQLPKD